MSTKTNVSVLELTLHGRRVGFLAGYQNSRNILTFDEKFKTDPNRPTFSLITHPGFPKSDRIMAEPWARSQRLHPVLSNLLPEGALRELLAQGLKTHPDNEFELLSHLGRDLPGALIATPLRPEDVPRNILEQYANVTSVPIATQDRENRFSLAGVQMKFSMREKEGRYQLSESGSLGDWIIKTPSTKHKHLPLNEYTAMKLAEMAGVNIPEIKLVELDKLDHLPQINLPEEKFAFAIKRFDRQGNERIHTEDFAQVMVKYAHEKYGSTNYEQIGKILYEYTGDGLANVQQFARRLLVNILLANGDAHLKNWSLLYQDQVTAELTPAYDIVTTSVYIEGEKRFALNLGKNKEWYKATMEHFEAWAEKAGIPWRAIRPHLKDTMEKVRTHWPQTLKNLPMADNHRTQLITHWDTLEEDFRINNTKKNSSK